MKNLGNMLKQAKEMQSKMEDMQRELEETTIEGTSGGGMVTVTMSGKGALKGIKIDPSLLKADEADMLEDLIIAAHGDAKARIETKTKEAMADLTGGMPLPPGFKLPF